MRPCGPPALSARRSGARRAETSSNLVLPAHMLTVIEICPLAAIRNCPMAATSVAECDCPMRCGAPGAVDRRGALLLRVKPTCSLIIRMRGYWRSQCSRQLLGLVRHAHRYSRDRISWERSSLEDHGQLGGDLL